jgi:hypothetical protein
VKDKIQKVKSKLIELGYLDNEWLVKYLEMLEINLDRVRDRKSTQEHHAIPVNSYWTSDEPYNRQAALKLARQDIDNFKVHLLYRDHLLIHSYLTLCTNLFEVQQRYEAQADLRKRNGRAVALAGNSQLKLKKTLSKRFTNNEVGHQNAIKRGELRQMITQLHENYVDLCSKFPSMYYAKKDAKVKEARQQWKQAVSEYNNFYINLNN